jgi:hypothetical protein
VAQCGRNAVGFDLATMGSGERHVARDGSLDRMGDAMSKSEAARARDAELERWNADVQALRDLHDRRGRTPRDDPEWDELRRQEDALRVKIRGWATG